MPIVLSFFFFSPQNSTHCLLMTLYPLPRISLYYLVESFLLIGTGSSTSILLYHFAIFMPEHVWCNLCSVISADNILVSSSMSSNLQWNMSHWRPFLYPRWPSSSLAMCVWASLQAGKTCGMPAIHISSGDDPLPVNVWSQSTFLVCMYMCS